MLCPSSGTSTAPNSQASLSDCIACTWITTRPCGDPSCRHPPCKRGSLTWWGAGSHHRSQALGGRRAPWLPGSLPVWCSTGGRRTGRGWAPGRAAACIALHGSSSGVCKGSSVAGQTTDRSFGNVVVVDSKTLPDTTVQQLRIGCCTNHYTYAAPTTTQRRTTGHTAAVHIVCLHLLTWEVVEAAAWAEKRVAG